jgi:hypothetical protein
MRIGLVRAHNHHLVFQGLALLLRRERDLEVVACCDDDLESLLAGLFWNPQLAGLGALGELVVI